MLLIKSSGGQENANIRYFTKNGYAKRFRTPKGLAKFYNGIEEDSRELIKMKNKLNKTDNRLAMKKIYELAIKTLREK